METFEGGDGADLDGYRPGGRRDNDFADFREISILPTTGELHSKEQPYLYSEEFGFETCAAHKGLQVTKYD